MEKPKNLHVQPMDMNYMGGIAGGKGRYQAEVGKGGKLGQL